MRVSTPDLTLRRHRWSLLGSISTVAALTALMTAPPVLAQTVSGQETAPVEMQPGQDVIVQNGASISVVCDASSTSGTTAIHTDEQGSVITINDGGLVELDDQGCVANNIDAATIAVDGNADPAINASLFVDNSGTINGIDGGYAIRVGNDVGALVDNGDGTSTEFAAIIGNQASGEINGDIYLGSGGNHTLESIGTINGKITGVGRTGLTINNAGILNAGSADDTAIEILDGGTEQRVIQLTNQGTMTGSTVLGGGANYQFTNALTIEGGLSVSQGGAANITYGQIVNGGTWTAGSSGVAIMLGDGLGGTDTVTAANGNVTTFERGFTISNNLGATLTGDVVIGDGGAHEFATTGDFIGRVMAGDGDNTITFSGGTAGLATGALFDYMNPLADTGDGDDRLSLSGSTVAPIFSTEDPTTVLNGTLFHTGSGDDTAELTRGIMRGADILLNVGDGDDRVLIAPAAFGDFEFEGEIIGGAGTDTLAVQGFDLDEAMELTGDWMFTGFENFEAPILEVIVNLDPALAHQFDVAGGTLVTTGTGVLRVRNGMDASTDQQDFADMAVLNGTVADATATQLFGASAITNDGGMILERPTFLTADGASFTQDETGSLLFAVSTDGTNLTNGALLINDPNAPNDPADPARVLLTEDSEIGLDMPTKDVMGRDTNGNAVEQGTFTVLVAPSVAVRDLQFDANGDPITPVDTDVTEADSTALDLLTLTDENPFYKFAFDVDTLTDTSMNNFTRVQIIATRTPGFAQTILDNGLDEALGAFGSGLDSVFDGCSDTDLANHASFCGELRSLGLRPDADIVTGLLQAAPNRIAGGHRAMVNNYTNANDVISARTSLIRASTIGPRTIRHSSYEAASEERGMAAGSVWASHHFWVQGWGSMMDQDSTSTAAGFDADNYGAVFGYDWRINRTNLLGFYATYGASDIEGKDVGQDRLDISGFGGGAYFTWFDRRTSAQIIVAGGATDYEGERLGLASKPLDRDYSGWYAGFRGSADTSFRTFGRMVMTPSASLQYMLNHEGDYDETGGVGAMSIDSRNGHSMQIRLANRLTAPVRMGSALGMPYVQLAWTHEFIDEAPETKGQFIGATNVVSVNAPEIAIVSDSYAAGVGFDLATRGGTSISAGYEFSYDQDAMAHTGALSIRVSF